MGLGGSKNKRPPPLEHPPLEFDGARRALLIGCNYPGTNASLWGCANDVQTQKALLKDVYGFKEEDMVILLDIDKKGMQPTGKTIKDELAKLVAISKAGDVLFMHYSGHGVQVPADDDMDEPDGLDEALCPSDFNFIIDDDLREILSALDPGCKFTMVSDCCHSGGMLDHREVVISGDASADEDAAAYKSKNRAREILLDDQNLDIADLESKNRAIDVKDMAQLLKERAGDKGAKEIEVSATKMRSALLRVFGDDASNAATARQAQTSTKSMSKYKAAGQKPAEDQQIDPNKGILVTGCQAKETSADVTARDGKSFGALTHTIDKVVRRHHKKNPDRPITNRELVMKVRHLLTTTGFAQNPCLECSEPNADSKYVLL